MTVLTERRVFDITEKGFREQRPGELPEDQGEPTAPDFTIPVAVEGEDQLIDLLMKWLGTAGFYWMVWDRVQRARFGECVSDEVFVRVHRRVYQIRKSGESDGFQAPADPGEIEEAFRRLGVVMSYWGKKSKFALQTSAGGESGAQTSSVGAKV